MSHIGMWHVACDLEGECLLLAVGVVATQQLDLATDMSSTYNVEATFK